MKSDNTSIQKLNEIGIALSKEKNIDALLEMIVVGCKELTNADAGTLYLIIADSHLKFEIVHTDSLNYAMGGTTGVPINFPFIPLYKDDGEPNLRMVAAYAVLQDKAVNIADAYQSDKFDFSGTKEFDTQTGYRSTSFLTIPMKDHNEEIIGAIQLINAIDPNTGKIISFSDADLNLAKSLTSQAAVALSRKKLEDSLRQYVDLHKVINSLLMVSWEKGSLDAQFSKVLDIVLGIPIMEGFNNGGVYIQAANGEQKSLYIDQNIGPEGEKCYQNFCQQEDHCSNEIIYLDSPIRPNFDHLVIPLIYTERCIGAIFLEIASGERLSWEKELFLLSATEPVATILERRHLEINLLQSKQKNDRFIDKIKKQLVAPLTCIEKNVQDALVSKQTIDSSKQLSDQKHLSEQLAQIQQAAQDIKTLVKQIDTFSEKK